MFVHELSTDGMWYVAGEVYALLEEGLQKPALER